MWQTHAAGLLLSACSQVMLLRCVSQPMDMTRVGISRTPPSSVPVGLGFRA